MIFEQYNVLFPLPADGAAIFGDDEQVAHAQLRKLRLTHDHAHTWGMVLRYWFWETINKIEFYIWFLVRLCIMEERQWVILEIKHSMQFIVNKKDIQQIIKFQKTLNNLFIIAGFQ